MKRLVMIVVLTAILTGCSSRSSHVSTQVSSRIQDRTGHGLNPDADPSKFSIPPGVSITDGLSEDEAVAIALWNNAGFQSDVTSLGFARADLIEAGQLRNPVLTLLLPWGPKQLEYTVSLPVEVFWQRPRRVAAAKLDLERVAESLVQTGLNLVRDVRVAYVDLMLANERANIAGNALRLQTEIVQIVEARLRAGDISELETNPARIEAEQAAEQVNRFNADARIARDRLRFLLGMPPEQPTFDLTADASHSMTSTASSANIIVTTNSAPAQQQKSDNVDALVKRALAARPDLRAAELAIDAAGKRAKWERSRILSISALLDANAQGKKGFEAGPGVQAELPIFNRNRGGITRAEAEIERAARQYIAVRHRITLEVEEAYIQVEQARQSVESWRNQIASRVEEDIRIAQKAYIAGEVPYLFVLETSRRLTDARLREAESRASVRRATAQLERAIGRKIGEST